MSTLQKLIRHPAGRMGLVIGVVCGCLATVMGEGSKALLLVGVCRALAIERSRHDTLTLPT